MPNEISYRFDTFIFMYLPVSVNISEEKIILHPDVA